MYRLVLILCVAPLICTAQVIRLNNADGGALQCSGSIIHERWILTAASCFDSNYNMILNVGGQSYVGVEQIIRHRNYIPNYPDNDIALLRLNANIVSSSGIQRTPLDLNDATDYRNTDLHINTEILKVVDESYCAGYTNNYLNLICASDESGQSCQVIAGSPVLFNNRQVGLEIRANSCGNQAHMLTRVSRHADWLMNQLALYGDQLSQ